MVGDTGLEPVTGAGLVKSRRC